MGRAQDAMVTPASGPPLTLEGRHTAIDLDSALDFVESLGYTTQAIADRSVIDRALLDVDRDHRGRAGEAGYVNNFIFRPAA